MTQLTVEGNTDRVDLELRWAGGFVSRHTLTRPVQTYEQLSNYRELVASLCAQGFLQLLQATIERHRQAAATDDQDSQGTNGQAAAWRTTRPCAA